MQLPLSRTHHDGEHEGDDVDGIGGTEAGEDAEEQVVLGPRLRRLVGQLILDVGLGAVLQSPLDVGAGGERGHGAASAGRAAESAALRAGPRGRARSREGKGGGVSVLQGQRWGGRAASPQLPAPLPRAAPARSAEPGPALGSSGGVRAAPGRAALPPGARLSTCPSCSCEAGKARKAPRIRAGPAVC